MGSMTSSASDSLSEIMSRLDARVKRVDEERWLSSRYAAPEVRQTLIVLYAFYYELARVRLVVSDETMGQIRFQWWRDVLSELAEGKTREHDLSLALAEEVGAGRLQMPRLAELIDRHQAAFLANDRGLEPEGDLAVIAADICSPGYGVIDQIRDIAPIWAKLRRGDAHEAAQIWVKMPADVRAGLAHLRLRHAWARGKALGPLQTRLSILLAMMTGKV